MLRVCSWVADQIEMLVNQIIAVITSQINTICHQVTQQIEQWQQRFENQCHQVSSQVCTWLPWPLDDLCNWVTDTVCNLVAVLVKVIVTIVKTVCETIISLVTIFIRIPMTIVLTVMRIVCFVIDYVINWIKIIISVLVGIPEFLLCLLGLRIRKTMHVCVTVLAGKDGKPVVDLAQVTMVMDDAAAIISKRM